MILKFKDFLLEALRDEISQHHIDRIKHYKASHLLDFEVPKKTDKIIEGNWTLTNEEKTLAIDAYFDLDYEKCKDEISYFEEDQHFFDCIEKAYLKGDKCNVKKPSVKDLYEFYKKDTFRLISVGETKSDSRISRDKDGKPLLDDNGNIIREPKKVGDIIWNKSTGNINDFITSYELTYNKRFTNPYKKYFAGIASKFDGKYDINLFENFDLHLYITGKPSDILNQSMTNFFYSCQTLYREEHNFSDLKPLMANVFDENTKICYLIFDTPWTDKYGKVYPFTAFSRMFIRLVDGNIYFDQVYPDVDNMIQFLHKMVTKYTGMISIKTDMYDYNYSTPDEYARHSYMDVLNPKWNKKISEEDLLKNPKYKALSEYLGISPIEINYIGNNIYETPTYNYTLLNKDDIEDMEVKYQDELKKTFDKWRELTINKIKDMVYKQEYYKDFVDIDKFVKNEREFLNGYIGGSSFDDISKWAELKKISKHDLYRAIKPYLKQSFWDDKLSEENVNNKYNKLIADNEASIPKKKIINGEMIDIGYGIMAYKK